MTIPDGVAGRLAKPPLEPGAGAIHVWPEM